MDEHCRLFPDCPFIHEKYIKVTSASVPTGGEKADVSGTPSKRTGGQQNKPLIRLEHLTTPSGNVGKLGSQRQACTEELAAASVRTANNVMNMKEGSNSSSRLTIDSGVSLLPFDDLEPTGMLPPPVLKYKDSDQRLASFRQRWTKITPTPEQLASAGFYYIGPDDRVRCFHCGGCLHNWEPTDDPWHEHCQCFPGCPFGLKNSVDHALLPSSPPLAPPSPAPPPPTPVLFPIIGFSDEGKPVAQVVDEDDQQMNATE
jgi:hypothetical protein